MGFWERHLSNKTEKQARSLMAPGEALVEHALGTAPGGTYLVAAGDQALYILRLNGLMEPTRLPYGSIATALLQGSVLQLTTRSGSAISIALQGRPAGFYATVSRQAEALAPRLVS